MTVRGEMYLALICVLCLKVSQAVRVGNVRIQSELYQTKLPSAEYSIQYDDDEIYHVDYDNKEARWRMAQFGDRAGANIAGALQNKAVMTKNYQIWTERANYTAATPVTPIIYVFSEDPVVLNEPNTLICYVREIFPPVISMTWMKNNQPVTKGVSETDYYIASDLSDLSYYKFIYLTMIPAEGDVYTCSVEHPGLSPNPTNKIWSPEIPVHMSETSENIVCGLGLAIGIVGIVAGICLIFKGIKKNQNTGH